MTILVHRVTINNNRLGKKQAEFSYGLLPGEYHVGRGGRALTYLHSHLVLEDKRTLRTLVRR